MTAPTDKLAGHDGDSTPVRTNEAYASGSYWTERMDMLYYQYLDYIIRTVAPSATSMIDVGTGNCPYLEWFDWIPDKNSADIRVPYESENVKPIHGNILEIDLGRRFDLCTCLQVLEHVPEPAKFAKRLSELADLLVISVPYCWPENSSKWHLHDPVTLEKLVGWFGREPNFKIVVAEPFRSRKNERLIVVFHKNPDRKYGIKDADMRVRRNNAFR
jgi:hypothetical protein